VINTNFGFISHRLLDTATLALNIPFKIAAKPLQMETGLLLTAYKKLPAPYLMLPSPTPYDLPFSHNITRFM